MTRWFPAAVVAFAAAWIPAAAAQDVAPLADDLGRDLALTLVAAHLQEPAEGRTAALRLAGQRTGLSRGDLDRLRAALLAAPVRDDVFWNEVPPAVKAALGTGTGEFLVHFVLPGPAPATRTLLRRGDAFPSRVTGDTLAVRAVVVPPAGAGRGAAAQTVLTVRFTRTGDPGRAALGALAETLRNRLAVPADAGPGHDASVLLGRGTLAVPYDFAVLEATWRTAYLADAADGARLDGLRDRLRELETVLADDALAGRVADPDSLRLYRQAEDAWERAVERVEVVEADIGPLERVSRSRFGASLLYAFGRFDDVVLGEDGAITVEDPDTQVYAAAQWYPWGYYSGGDGTGGVDLLPALLLGARLDFDHLEPVAGVSLGLRFPRVTPTLSLAPWIGWAGRVQRTVVEGTAAERRLVEFTGGIAVSLHP